MKNTRMKPEARKEDILRAALALAIQHGYTELSRERIADAAGVTGPAIQYHFATMPQFRRDLMRYAVRERCAIVVAQGLALRDPQAQKADDELRHAARRSLF